MNNCIQFMTVLICLSLPLPAAAGSDELFIPLGTTERPARIITVSHKGGDFTDPTAALASITDATADNRYLVLIGPGVYTLTQTLAMKPFVDIAGAGQEATKLTGEITEYGSHPTTTSAIVSGSDNATLHDLTIENTGGHDVLSFSTALYNGYCSPVIHNVTATAIGGFYDEEVINFGVYNDNSSVTMTGVTATATGGISSHGVYNNNSTVTMTGGTATAIGYQSSYGVWNYDSTVTMTDMTAKAIGAWEVNIAVTIHTSSVTMTGVTATASSRGDSNNKGVDLKFSTYSTFLVLTDVVFEAAGGRFSYGLHVNAGNLSPPVVSRRSIFRGETSGISLFDNRSAFIVQSSIIGGVDLGDGATITCVHADDGEAAELDSDCQPLP